MTWRTADMFTCVVDVSNIVALGRLSTVVVDHGEELVLPLFAGVLALAGLTQDVAADLEVHTEVHLLHDLLAASCGAVVNKPLQVED